MVFTCKALVVAFLFVAKEDEDDFFEIESLGKQKIYTRKNAKLQ